MISELRQHTAAATLVLMFALSACGGDGSPASTTGPESAPGGSAPGAAAPSSPAPSSPETTPPDTTAPATTSSPEAPAESTRRVRTVDVSTGELTATKNAAVTIEASRVSQVAAGTGGRVTRVHARPGAVVASGQLVVTLDDEQLRNRVQNAILSVESANVSLDQAERRAQETVAELEARLQSARSNLELAEARLEEGTALLQAGGISRVESISLEAQRDQAQSAFVQARDALARARRASQEDLRLLELQRDQALNQLEQARASLRDASVTAPFAGEVADVFVEEGEFLGAGSPVFRLIARNERRATFSVSAEDAPLLEAQGLIYVRYGGLDYAAQITRATRSAQEPRLVRLSADLYPSETPIPTGSVAQVRYTVPLATGVVVPSAALVAEAGTTYVFAAVEGVARRTPVRVIAESGSRAVVEGLPVGTSVISPRPLDVRDGTRVQSVDE